jgi:hypothetical protein
MKLIPKHFRPGGRPLRIEISEAEITADLLYPAGSRAASRVSAATPRAKRR